MLVTKLMNLWQSLTTLLFLHTLKDVQYCLQIFATSHLLPLRLQKVQNMIRCRFPMVRRTSWQVPAVTSGACPPYKAEKTPPSIFTQITPICDLPNCINHSHCQFIMQENLGPSRARFLVDGSSGPPTWRWSTEDWQSGQIYASSQQGQFDTTPGVFRSARTSII